MPFIPHPAFKRALAQVVQQTSLVSTNIKKLHYIALEGMSGCGKTTTATEIALHLQNSCPQVTLASYIRLNATHKLPSDDARFGYGILQECLYAAHSSESMRYRLSCNLGEVSAEEFAKTLQQLLDISKSTSSTGVKGVWCPVIDDVTLTDGTVVWSLLRAVRE